MAKCGREHAQFFKLIWPTSIFPPYKNIYEPLRDHQCCSEHDFRNRGGHRRIPCLPSQVSSRKDPGSHVTKATSLTVVFSKEDPEAVISLSLFFSTSNELLVHSHLPSTCWVSCAPTQHPPSRLPHRRPWIDLSSLMDKMLSLFFFFLWQLILCLTFFLTHLSYAFLFCQKKEKFDILTKWYLYCPNWTERKKIPDWWLSEGINCSRDMWK